SISSFLGATTDSLRLAHASAVSRQVLGMYEMEELEDLRQQVQLSELLRVIPYGRQTDHSAHTLYVYLLGVYLFLWCRTIRESIATHLGEKPDSKDLVERFLFRWVYASLLHDVGYVFQGRAKEELRAVDRMFSPTSIILTLCDEAAPIRHNLADRLHGRKWNPGFASIDFPEVMLDRLRHLPWGSDLGIQSLDAFVIFARFSGNKRPGFVHEVEKYAYHVATTGYDGLSHGTLDHGVGSGLFLLMYSSYWYWMAVAMNRDGPFQGYDLDEYFKKDIVPACFAAASHNLIKRHAPTDKPAAVHDPILYLGILCDELQKWDRFPAGEDHLRDLDKFKDYCCDSEGILLVHVDGKTLIEFPTVALSDSVHDCVSRIESPDEWVTIGHRREGGVSSDVVTTPAGSLQDPLQTGDDV
ncbi:MAG: hypothetical protein ABIP48_33215, partial [Planctomycetota bacterium]